MKMTLFKRTFLNCTWGIAQHSGESITATEFLVEQRKTPKFSEEQVAVAMEYCHKQIRAAARFRQYEHLRFYFDPPLPEGEK